MKEKENTRVRMPKITATSPPLHVSAPTHSLRGTGEGKGPLDDDKCRWEQENAAGQFLRVRGVGGVTWEFLPFLRLPNGDAEPGPSCLE